MRRCRDYKKSFNKYTFASENMNSRNTYLLLIACLLLLGSCNDMSSQNRAPIVLGDSSTIVRETDTKKLKDIVTDLQPVTAVAPKADTPKPAPPTAPDTSHRAEVKKTNATPPASTPQTGLTTAFSEVTIFIPNVTAKLAGNKNLLHANDAVYQLQSGNLNGNAIKVTGNVTKVSQRYQTMVVIKNNLGVLPLETLLSTTSWQAMAGGNNTYPISGLDQSKLSFQNVSASAMRNAVVKAARKHRFSRKKEQEWLNSIHNVRAANQKPAMIMLRSVMWKIDGKDTKGKNYSKQIRMDMPPQP